MMPAARCRLILPLAALALAAPAFAADYPVLRGSHAPSLPPAPVIDYPAVADWNGFYIGGFGSYNAGDIRTRRAPLPGNPLDTGARHTPEYLINTAVHQSLANSGVPTVEASGLITRRNPQASRMGYGVFLGYNIAAEDALYGIEADYTRTDLTGHMTTLGPVSASSGGSTLTVHGANTSTSLDGFGTVRGRAGLIYGNLLTYVTGGVAFGHGSVTQNIDFSHTGMARQQIYQRRQISYTGFTIGAGLEAQFGGLLLRGEYLFTRLQGPSNQEPITVNSARIGAGVKF